MASRATLPSTRTKGSNNPLQTSPPEWRVSATGEGIIDGVKKHLFVSATRWPVTPWVMLTRAASCRPGRPRRIGAQGVAAGLALALAELRALGMLSGLGMLRGNDGDIVPEVRVGMMTEDEDRAMKAQSNSETPG